MRGEEPVAICSSLRMWELPPHARRRGDGFKTALGNAGITSACAEKRGHAGRARRWSRNYLRMRGEEQPKRRSYQPVRELPPHARRRDGDPAMAGQVRGITSACAEKRRTYALSLQVNRNYLRMRGEEAHNATQEIANLELPPHARRRVTHPFNRSHKRGITSACAEKRQIKRAITNRGWNYLRMRGEECLPR